MNQDEIKSIVAFCKLCDRLATSTFGCQFKVAFCKTYRVQSDTLHATRIKKFNRDEFHSFLIHFRKLLLEKEAANFYRVLNILSRYGNDLDRNRLKQIKTELRNVSEAVAGVGCCIGNSFRPVRPKEVADVYFNGILFHNDENLTSDIKFLEEAGSFPMHALLHYVIFIHKQALRLAGSIRLRGIV